MDDRKFREIMEDYARSTAKGKDVDFAKLNRAEKSPKRKINLRWVTAVCSAVVIIAVSLAVALPLTLGGNPNEGVVPGQGDEPQYFYCKSDKTENIAVESFETLTDEYGLAIIEPDICTIDCADSLIYSEEYNVVIGAYLELNVFDIYFDTISIRVIKHQYILEGLTRFDDCNITMTWNELQISYSVGDFNSDGYYNYRITFTADGYNYFIELDCYGELGVAAILDMIYG